MWMQSWSSIEFNIIGIFGEIILLDDISIYNGENINLDILYI